MMLGVRTHCPFQDMLPFFFLFLLKKKKKKIVSASMCTSLLDAISLSTSHGRTLQQNNQPDIFLCIYITDGKKSY